MLNKSPVNNQHAQSIASLCLLFNFCPYGVKHKYFPHSRFFSFSSTAPPASSLQFLPISSATSMSVTAQLWGTAAKYLCKHTQTQAQTHTHVNAPCYSCAQGSTGSQLQVGSFSLCRSQFSLQKITYFLMCIYVLV